MIELNPDLLAGKLKQELPGVMAQQLMAPSVRFNGIKRPDPSESQDSSILIALFQSNGVWSTVLMERTRFGPHGGQISFPGGRWEPIDPSLEATAIREAEEEVGIPGKHVSILGQLSRLYVPNSNFWIYPFVGYIDYEPEWIADQKEVARIIPMPLDRLLDPRIKMTKKINRNGYVITAPYYGADNLFIWGATAMIISELEVLLSD